MTYAEKLAEFVKATGSKPGEMNNRASRVHVTSDGGIAAALDYEPAGRKSSGITAPPCRGEALHSAGEPLKTAVAPWVGTATPGQKQGHGGSHAAPAADDLPSQGQVLGLTGDRAICNLEPSEGEPTDEPQHEGSTTCAPEQGARSSVAVSATKLSS